MSYYQMLAIAPQIAKFSALLNSHRIFKPRLQTIFEAADLITPQFKVAKETAMQNMRTLASVNPMAGGFNNGN